MTNNMVWLPHLKNAVPKEAYGYKISMYTIALEGWRRGLKLKFYSKYNKAKDKFLIHYSLSNGKKTHRFVISRGDKVEKEAINICVNKDLTKKYLDNAKVETPKGYVFSEHTTKDDIIAQSSQLGYPLVLKPTAGSVGRGVFSNIQNENELIFAIDYVRDKLGLKEVIVEKYIRGEDYRLYVVDGKVISAFKKIPPNVIGDGESTLLQLIRQKNKMRQKVPSLYNHPIRVDGELKEYIKKYNYKIESVPKKGEVVYLKSKNNVSQGGDPVDMTDKIPYKIKEIAVNATRAIPGLVQCGVDMIIDLEKESGYVIELNSKPGITSHLFPLEGEPRDVPKEIIDFYFPETKNNKINYDYYFDLESVYRPILHGNAKEITLPKIHLTPEEKKKIKITNIDLLVSKRLLNSIRKLIRNNILNGYVKKLSDNSIIIIVAGSKRNINKFNKEIDLRFKDSLIKRSDYKKPVKIGTEILASKKISSNKKASLQSRIDELLEENTQLKKDNDLYVKNYNSVINSRSWKIINKIKKRNKD